METGLLSHCCCSFCCCSAPSLVFFVLCLEICLIAVVVPLPPFRSSSYLCRLELEKWSVMNILCEPFSFSSTDNQSVFGRAGLNLGNNEMRRALPVSGWLSWCVRQAINHLFFALPKRFLWCKRDNNIHDGKQVQCFLAFCCLILFAVACCGRISSPILLRLCSELLAHELLFVMNYKKGLIVCFLLAC